MPGLVLWGGRFAIGWLASSIFSSAAETVEASADLTAQINKALPWVAGGVALYLIMQRGR